MGFLSKLFGRSSDKVDELPARSPEEVQATCPHGTITGRWDSVADMGHEDRATKFVCEACNKEFTREEAQHIRATATSAIADVIGADSTQSTRP